MGDLGFRVIRKGSEIGSVAQATISQWGRSIRPFGNEVITFRFRNDIQDLWYKAGLTDTKSGVTFYAEGSEWLSGTHARIEGVEAVRMNEKVVVTDHLRFRNKPSTSARIRKVSYPCCGPSPITEHDFFLKGTVLGALARTAEKDNVQGLSAYWYYVEWVPFETPVFGWVYGAYLTPFEKTKESIYDKMWSKDQASVSEK